MTEGLVLGTWSGATESVGEDRQGSHDGFTREYGVFDNLRWHVALTPEAVADGHEVGKAGASGLANPGLG